MSNLCRSTGSRPHTSCSSEILMMPVADPTCCCVDIIWKYHIFRTPCMFATNALPFPPLSLFVWYQYIHLLLCHSARLSASVRPSVRPSVCPSFCLSVRLSSLLGSSGVSLSGRRGPVGQLQLIQHHGQLHRAKLPWQRTATACPSKMWSFCGQDYVDLTMSSV